MLAAAAAALITFIPQTSGTTATLRGIAAVSGKVAWATGAHGTVLRTTDAGAHWTSVNIPGSPDLDFRDVHAETASLAYVLAAGPGPQSKLYKTTDGGETWTLLLTNPDPQGFFDAIAFFDANNGLILGDPVDGRFVILSTPDGGTTWQRQPTPPALPGEGALAASGTCLITRGSSEAWFATGGPGASRLFHTTDRGRTWTVHATPIRNTAQTDGIYGLAATKNLTIAVGGNYQQPDETANAAALNFTTPTNPGGYRSAAVIHRNMILTVGSHGASYSHTRGRTWTPLDYSGFHALSITTRGAGWAVGAKGQIAAVLITSPAAANSQ